MAKITYDNKSALNINPDIPNINKVTADDMNEIKNSVNYLYDNGGGGGGADTLPIGTIVGYPSETAPTDWLICDGSAVSRTNYAELFAIIGTTYGNGDGSTTFNLPNYKDKVPVGLDVADSDFNVIGKTGGSKYLQKHSHQKEENLYKYEYNAGIDGQVYKAGNPLQQIVVDSGEVVNVQTGNSGNLQPYIVQIFIIKAFKSATTTAEVENSLESDSTTNVPSVHAVSQAIKNIGTVLFNGSELTSVTLSDSVANYKYIDIVAQKSGAYNTTRIYDPNNKQVTLYIPNFYDTTAMQELYKKVQIQNNTITKMFGGFRNSDGAGSGAVGSNDEMYIMQVIGYK